MTPPSEKLAGSLDALRSLQERGIVAVRAADLPRSHRERLVRHGTVAGRLAAAFRDVGRDGIANEIVETMRAADFDVRESSPFVTASLARPIQGDISPVVRRLRLIWEAMRPRALPLPATRSCGAELPRTHARSTANDARLRASLLNSTAIRWMGSPRLRYLSA